MATISNTPRPAYAWSSTDNVWYPIGVGAHSHSDVPLATITAKGDIIVGTGSATVTNLSVGANGYALVADSTQTTGIKWAVPTDTTKIPLSTVTTTGDLILGTGSSTVSRVGVGINYQQLVPDSTQTAGVRWGDDNNILAIMGAYN